MFSALTLRPATETDRPLLRQVYASARAKELAQVDWPEDQKQAFLDQQFNAQDLHYRTYYPTAQFLVIEHAGQPVGRLYLAEWPGELRIMDIALLPEFRGRGWGTALLQQVLAQARAQGLAVSIHVEKFNPAYRLYTRLGFRPVGEHGLYDLLRWETP